MSRFSKIRLRRSPLPLMATSTMASASSSTRITWFNVFDVHHLRRSEGVSFSCRRTANTVDNIGCNGFPSCSIRVAAAAGPLQVGPDHVQAIANRRSRLVIEAGDGVVLISCASAGGHFLLHYVHAVDMPRHRPLTGAAFSCSCSACFRSVISIVTAGRIHRFSPEGL